MPFETHELDAIKAAVSASLAENHRDFGLTPNGAQALGLILLAAIDAAAMDPSDPRPFAPGRKVRIIASGVQGTIARTVEESGELHTVIVTIPVQGFDAQVPFGPRELEVLP